MKTESKCIRSTIFAKAFWLTSLSAFCFSFTACSGLPEMEDIPSSNENIEASGDIPGLAESNHESSNQNKATENTAIDFYLDGALLCNPLGGSPEEQAEAGATGLVYGGNVCAWTCGGMTIAFRYAEDSGEWNLTASNLDIDSSNDFEYPSGGDNSDWFGDVIENGLESADLPSCGEWSTSLDEETRE